MPHSHFLEIYFNIILLFHDQPTGYFCVFVWTSKRAVPFSYLAPTDLINFFLNNQPDALIIQIYFLPIIRSFILELQFHPDSAWKRSSKTLHETYQYRMYSRKLLMMGR
jgi:hypothetical protein